MKPVFEGPVIEIPSLKLIVVLIRGLGKGKKLVAGGKQARIKLPVDEKTDGKFLRGGFFLG